MSKITTLYINSKDRIKNGSSTATNFNINLFPLGVGSNVSWCVKDVTIPFSYIVSVPFPENGDIFQSFELIEDGVPPTSVIVNIPCGNYTRQQLEAELKNQLDTSSPFGNTYTVNINEITGKTVISALGFGFVINWTNSNVTADIQYKRIGNILGWFNPENGNTENAISPVGAIKTAPQTYNLSGPLCLYLKSSSLTIGSTNFFNNDNIFGNDIFEEFGFGNNLSRNFQDPFENIESHFD